jgi:hypothetical protein
VEIPRGVFLPPFPILNGEIGATIYRSLGVYLVNLNKKRFARARMGHQLAYNNHEITTEGYP